MEPYPSDYLLFNKPDMVGRTVAPKDVDILTPGTCECYVTLQWGIKVADRIKVD